MIYVWTDKTSGKEVEVDRKMLDSQVEPTIEEAEMSEEEYEKAEWERVITGGSATITWGGKGYW